MSWTPVVSILFAQFLFLGSWIISRRLVKYKLFWKNFGLYFLTFLLLVPYKGEIKNIINKNYENRLFTKRLESRFFRFNNFEEHKKTLDFIKDNSKNEDAILVWGSESAIYVLSDRNSPSRYFYQYPLFTPGYATSERIREFTDSIKANKPKVIIDTSASTFDKEIDNVTVIPPIDSQRRQGWLPVKRKLENLKEFDEFFKFVEENYEFVETTYEDKWQAYRLRK